MHAKSTLRKPCSISKGHYLKILHKVDIWQWTCNVSEVVGHLPPEARSTKLELWLSQDKADQKEPTLGLGWHCKLDNLGLKQRPITYNTLLMWSISQTAGESVQPSWSHPSRYYQSLVPVQTTGTRVIHNSPVSSCKHG